MECKFIVGQKVVCVYRATNWRPVFASGEECAVRPEFNQIYTVTWVGTDPRAPAVVGLLLKEISSRIAFAAVGFRPLHDRPKEADTDIGVFTKLLDTKKLEDAR